MKIIVILGVIILVLIALLTFTSPKNNDDQKAIEPISSYLVSGKDVQVIAYEFNSEKDKVIYLTTSAKRNKNRNSMEEKEGKTAAYEYDLETKETRRVFEENAINTAPYPAVHLTHTADNIFYIFLDTKIITVQDGKITENIPVVKLYETANIGELNKKLDEEADNMKFKNREERLAYLRKRSQESLQPTNETKEEACSRFGNEAQSLEAIIKQGTRFKYYVATDSTGEKKAIDSSMCDTHIFSGMAKTTLRETFSSKFKDISSSNNGNVKVNEIKANQKIDTTFTDNDLRIQREGYECVDSCAKWRYVISNSGKTLFTVEGFPYLELPYSQYAVSARGEFVFRYADKLFVYPLEK